VGAVLYVVLSNYIQRQLLFVLRSGPYLAFCPSIHASVSTAVRAQHDAYAEAEQPTK